MWFIIFFIVCAWFPLCFYGTVLVCSPETCERLCYTELVGNYSCGSLGFSKHAVMSLARWRCPAHTPLPKQSDRVVQKLMHEAQKEFEPPHFCRRNASGASWGHMCTPCQHERRHRQLVTLPWILAGVLPLIAHSGLPFKVRLHSLRDLLPTLTSWEFLGKTNTRFYSCLGFEGCVMDDGMRWSIESSGFSFLVMIKYECLKQTRQKSFPLWKPANPFKTWK